jgi:small multidrug resistance family-3 protein
MKNLISRLLHAAHHFTGFDFAVLKISLIFIGILLGAYFSNFFQTWIVVVWIIAITSLAAILIITIRKTKEPKD